MPFWDNIKNIAYEELKQRGEEGCDVAGFREKLDACGDDASALLAVFDEMEKLEISPDFPYNEPDGWDEIMALSDGDMPKLPELDDEAVTDRIQGAWLGRCCGCALGKPFEAYPYVCGKDDARPSKPATCVSGSRAGASCTWPASRFASKPGPSAILPACGRARSPWSCSPRNRPVISS